MISYPKIIRCVYTLGYYLAVPCLLLRLAWRSLRYNRNYGARWIERFGWVEKVAGGQVIWIHAVSLGETLAAAPLVKALLDNYSHYRLVVTSTTPTGAAQVRNLFGNQVTSVYTPYDLPGAMQRFLRRVHPNLGIILETELWPNMLAVCAQRKIPLVLANARLSERSCRGYQRIAPLAREMVNSFCLIAAQSKLDGERFLALGLEPERLRIAGNIKFDKTLSQDLKPQSDHLRQSWGHERLVWVAASTHEGEESIILTALASVQKEFPDSLLILVPRHPERFNKAAQLCVDKGYRIFRRSQGEMIYPETDVLLADTLGELMLFYSAADVAFVGGSLVPIGGHNLVEPALTSAAILTGPHLHNFIEISQLLLAAEGVQIINDAESLSVAVIELFRSPDRRQHMVEQARQAVLANTGALKKHLEWIAGRLD